MGKNKWASKLNRLIEECHQQGITVKFVPDAKTRDYIGMNPEAAKDMGFRIPPKTIYIDRNLSIEDKYHVLKHEMIEYGLMQGKNYTYWKAHCYALDHED